MIVWPFPPQSELTETFKWKTDVLSAYSKEQRISLRPQPRIELEMDFQFYKMEHEHAIYIARNYGADVILIPLWFERAYIGEINETLEINVTTSNVRYNKRVFIYSSNKYQVCEIETVESDKLILKEKTLKHVNAWVMPCYETRFTDPIEINGFSADYVTGSATFEITENTNVTGSHNYSTFEDYPVMDDRNVKNSVSFNYGVNFDAFEGVAGNVWYSKLNSYSSSSGSLNWSFDSSEEAFELIKFLTYLNGMQKAFYVPTWTNDFNIAEGTYTENYLDIEVGRAQEWEYEGCVYVLLKNGNSYVRRIEGWENLSWFDGNSWVDGDGYYAGRTRMVLENSLPNLESTEIELICRLPLVRLNSDNIDFNRTGGYNIDVSIPYIEVPE